MAGVPVELPGVLWVLLSLQVPVSRQSIMTLFYGSRIAPAGGFGEGEGEGIHGRKLLTARGKLDQTALLPFFFRGRFSWVMRLHRTHGTST